MKIFFSHSSRDKPLIREIRSNLPKRIKGWLDEIEMIGGDSIEDNLKKAITDEADLLVIFLSMEAVESEWVKKELNWALKHEAKIGHEFVIPVLLEKSAWERVEPVKFRTRKYLECTDFTENGVKAFSSHLSDHLFAWLDRYLEKSKEKETKKDIIVEAGMLEVGEVPDNIGVDTPVAFFGRVRNEGKYAVKLTDFGVHATNEEGVGASLSQAPMGHEEPGMIEPGETHEFFVDMYVVVVMLQCIKWTGNVTIGAYYQAYDFSKYESDWETSFDILEMEKKSKGKEGRLRK